MLEGPLYIYPFQGQPAPRARRRARIGSGKVEIRVFLDPRGVFATNKRTKKIFTKSQNESRPFAFLPLRGSGTMTKRLRGVRLELSRGRSMQGWRRFALVMGCLLLGASAALRLIPSRPLPSAPLASSAAREAAEEAEGEPTYVGVQACAACHADQYRSYLSTAHSRALADIDQIKQTR